MSESEELVVPVMKTFFFDANALVKLVVDEPGRKKAETCLNSTGYVYTSWLCIAEALGVLRRKWEGRGPKLRHFIQRSARLRSFIHWAVVGGADRSQAIPALTNRKYSGAVHLLLAYVSERRIKAQDVECSPRAVGPGVGRVAGTNLSPAEVEAIERLREANRHDPRLAVPDIDLAIEMQRLEYKHDAVDAAILLLIERNGLHRFGAADSQLRFVSADKHLLRAARRRGYKTVSVASDEWDDRDAPFESPLGAD